MKAAPARLAATTLPRFTDACRAAPTNTSPAKKKGANEAP
jgi:hypothetical protein